MREIVKMTLILVTLGLFCKTSTADLLDQHFEPVEIVDGQTAMPTQPFVEESTPTLGAEFSIGAETRFESSAQGNETIERSSPRFGIGVFRHGWLYQLQFGMLNEESKSGIFRVESERRELLGLVTYFSKPDGWWSPLLGGGLGLYQDITTTELSGLDSVTTESTPQFLLQGFGGLRLRYRQVYLQVQAQLAKRESSRVVEFGFLSQLGVTL
jgi:hypothetical protein